MQEHSYEHNTDQKVDLELIFRNFLHVLKRTWWWVTLLAILVGALRYVQAQRSFVPQYFWCDRGECGCCRTDEQLPGSEHGGGAGLGAFLCLDHSDPFCFDPVA